MGRARRLGGVAVAVALALLGGCAAGPGGRAAPGGGADGDFALGFTDTPAPGIYERELAGRRDRPGGTQGLWATVPGLPRVERAEIANLATGATVEVALFPGRVPAGTARISNAAAELLGLGAEPVRVRVTVLRREPVLVAP